MPYVFSASDFGFTDTDGNAMVAIRVTALPVSGTVVLDGVPVNVGQFVPVSSLSTGQLSFQSPANPSGNPKVAFQVKDNGGTANGGVDLDPTPNTITFNLLNINDAPNGADKTATVAAGTVYTFTVPDFGFTDTSDSPPNSFLAVRIASLPSVGALTSNSIPVTAGQEVSVADIAAAKLRYTAPADAAGSPFATLTFQVRDDGGTANGGSDLDQTASSFSFNATAGPNSAAPSGLDTTITLNEDTSHAFTTNDFPFTDTNGNSLASVIIAGLPAAGTLTLQGAPVSLSAVIAASELSGLVFTPPANASGAAFASLTFQVKDNGGTANGGTDLDASPNTITINVTPVNDPPAATDRTISLNAGAIRTLVISDFGFIDPSDNPQNTFAALRITVLPAAGLLTLAGIPVVAGNFISVSSIAAGQLQYASPVATSLTTIQFQVRDNGGTANGGVDLDMSPNQLSFNIAGGPVNQAPAGTDSNRQILEDLSYVIAAADFGFTDPDASAFAAVRIAALPAVGTLTMDNSPVAAGQIIEIANLGQLVYTPPANGNGAALANLTFQVQDNGGTGNGGVDLDPSPNTLTFNVTPVNDAPQGEDDSLMAEGASISFGLHNFKLSDPNDTPANTLLAIRIVALPAVGLLTLGETPVVLGQFITAQELAQGDLRWTAPTSGNPAGSFRFQVQDDGGTADAGLDLDLTANSIFLQASQITVAAEDGSRSFENWAQGLFPDVPPGGSPAFVFVTTNDNPALFANQPAIDSTGRLTFTPAPNSSGLATVTVVLLTGAEGEGDETGGEENPPRTFTIEVVQRNPGQNDNNPNDVNNDTHVAPDDALDVINFLNGIGPGEVPDDGWAGPFYDVDGDNWVVPADALHVINLINASLEEPTGPGDGGGVVGDGEMEGAGSGGEGESGRGRMDVLELLAFDVSSQAGRRRLA